MGQSNSIVLLLILAAAIALSFRRWMLDVLIEALNNLRGGGPPTPMHPSPANDAALLLKRAPQSRD